MSQELKEQIRGLIAEVTEKDVSEIADNVRLRDMGVDSMQALEIISDIERKFQIKIAESEFANISTLDSAAAFVAQKISAKQ